MDLIYHVAARAELEKAIAYYESKREGLGGDFQREIEAGERKIRSKPLTWGRVVGPFHRVLMKRFPYSLIYSVETTHINIVAVAHHRRKEDYWYSRVGIN